jgi:hypothetical protein
MKKQIHAYLLKQLGINGLIAVKAHIKYNTGDLSTLYKRIPAYIHYKRTKEDIFYDLHFHLSMVKDFAQYQ